MPPEVEQAAAEWPLANKDYENTRATFDAAIDSTNVHNLGVAWTFDISGISDWGGAASNPIIANGVLYFQDLASNVFAFDLETGALSWQRLYNRAALGPNGPGLGWGKVFIQDGVNRLIALDMDTGVELWATELDSSTGTQQPVAFNGYVYTGTGAGEAPNAPPEVEGRQSYTGGSSGHIYAVEQDTGQVHWHFQVVEEGFWGNPELNSGGAVWYPPGIDLATGMTYWGTGNPAPFPGILEYPNASSRPGPNLYTNTILALDAENGEVVWHHQAKPHDLFDLDYQNPPILATVSIGGQEREMVFGSGKLGKVYGYDRETGEVLWETAVGEHQNDDLLELPMGEVVHVMPGVWGGLQTPMAYADETLYALTINAATPWTATGWDAETAAQAVARGEARTLLNEATTDVVAINASNGEIRWQRRFDEPVISGMTVVNDLLFTTTLAGMIHAMSREDGSAVWSFQAPGGVIAWPAVAGDTIVWPVGLGSKPTLLVLRLGAREATIQPEVQPTLTVGP